MCDIAETIQIEQAERRALAEMTLAPHVEDSGSIATPEVAAAEFHKWLYEPPPEPGSRGPDAELRDLLGVS